uniref:RING-type domain-containing protein n=1 Tax=Seriola dumerili TaxID=41447 RepID=A0A3B4TF43_SERDU
MADVAETPLSLMSLEDELTCSICLSTFDCPVTTPCGHNFCQDCLLATWKETQRCPQCRTPIPTKPELKKNTVLSAVVETFNLSSNKTEDSLIKEEKKAEEKEDVIRDTSHQPPHSESLTLTFI